MVGNLQIVNDTLWDYYLGLSAFGMHISSPACISSLVFYCFHFSFVLLEGSLATAKFGNRFEMLGDFAVVVVKGSVLREIFRKNLLIQQRRQLQIFSEGCVV